MKIRSLLVLALCLFIGMLSAEAFGQTGQGMQYKYRQGDTTRSQVVIKFKVKSVSTMPGVGNVQPTELTLMGVRRQQIKQVFPNGDAEILYSFESMKISDGMKVDDMPLNQLSTMSMIVTPNGMVKDTRGLDSMGGSFGQIPFLNLENINQFISLIPTTALPVGEVWTQKIPFPSKDGKPNAGNLNMRVKLLSDNDSVGGVPTLKFEELAEGQSTFTVSVPPTGTAKLPRVMNSLGTVQARALNNFSPTLGQMVYTEGEGLVKIYMEIKESDRRVGVINTGVSINYKVALLNDKTGQQ